MVSYTLLSLLAATAVYAVPPNRPLPSVLPHLHSRAEATTRACDKLSHKFPQQLFRPNTTTYTEESTDYYSSSAILSPWCVFMPGSPEDVSAAIEVFTATQTKFAVRGGGHMAIEGAANTNEGVLMVLERLSEVSLTNMNGTQVAVIGTGSRWGSVYEVLSSQGITVAGGRYDPVGVGGQPLGGGISYFGSALGWTTSTILQYEVVLASGNIVKASAIQNPDLFWALKGGSTNFGVVTRYYMKTYPLGQITAGFIGNAEDNNGQLVDTIADYVTPGGGVEDPKSSIDCNLFFDTTSGSTTGFSSVFYNGTQDEALSLKNFTEMTLTSNSVSTRGYLDYLKETTGFGRAPNRSLWSTISLKSTPEAVKLAYRIYTAAIKSSRSRLMEIPEGSFTITWQPVTPSTFVEARRSGGDALDLDPADGGFLVMLFAASYKGVENEDFVKGFLKNMTDTTREQAESADLSYPFNFLNDAGADQKTYSLYGKGKSLPRLEAIAKKYDPKEVFQKLASGAFKLSQEGAKE